MKIDLQHIREIDKYFSNKQYDRAISLLERLIKNSPKEYSLRMKLADAYYLYGKNQAAVKVLARITEELAREGFITKAMAVQKRIQRIDPEFQIDIYSFIEENDSELEVESTAPEEPPKDKEAPPAEPEPPTNRFKALDGLFSGLSKEEFSSINGLLNEVVLEAGDDVFRQGDQDDSLYIIVSGSVMVHTTHNERKIELARLGEGSFFGEVALLTNKARTATVTSLEESVFLVLSRDNFETISDRYPDMKDNLLKALEVRAQDTIEKIIETEMEA